MFDKQSGPTHKYDVKKQFTFSTLKTFLSISLYMNFISKLPSTGKIHLNNKKHDKNRKKPIVNIAKKLINYHKDNKLKPLWSHHPGKRMSQATQGSFLRFLISPVGLCCLFPSLMCVPLQHESCHRTFLSSPSHWPPQETYTSCLWPHLASPRLPPPSSRTGRKKGRGGFTWSPRTNLIYATM